MKNELEIEGKLQFSNDDQRRRAFLERYEIAAADLPFDHKTTAFEEMLDRKIERTFQSRTPVNESINCPGKSLTRSLASAFSAAASSTQAKLSIAELQQARIQRPRNEIWPRVVPKFDSASRFPRCLATEERKSADSIGASAKRQGRAGEPIVRRVRSTSRLRARQANGLEALRR